jgi:hypothetical protein
VALDLEVAGTVYELTEPAEEAAKERPLVRLRDSHHTVARLFAHGLRPEEVSGQTGYSPSRLSTLQRDPSFQELVTFYRMDAREAKQDVEMQMLLVAKDAMQAYHERVLDTPDLLEAAELREGAKVFFDRAGFSPVQRSVNKNLNLNIAQRLDARQAQAASSDPSYDPSQTPDKLPPPSPPPIIVPPPPPPCPSPCDALQAASSDPSQAASASQEPSSTPSVKLSPSSDPSVKPSPRDR